MRESYGAREDTAALIEWLDWFAKEWRDLLRPTELDQLHAAAAMLARFAADVETTAR